MHMRQTTVMDNDPHIYLTICSPITATVFHELLTDERNRHKVAADGVQGSFSVSSGGLALESGFHSWFVGLSRLFSCCSLSKVQVSEGLCEFTT